MLAIIAAVIFVIAFLLDITGTATNVVFAPASLLLLGLACLRCTPRALARAGLSPPAAGGVY
jgi:hypothetical protein